VSEVWVPVPGFSGLYEASDLGRVRSVPRVVKLGGRFRGAARKTRGRVLKGGLVGARYYHVVLSRGGELYPRYVHRVVWESFNGPLPAGTEINHKDGNKGNNRLLNLEAVSHRRNIHHAIRNGMITAIGKKGEGNATAKLTDAAVLRIKRDYAAGRESMGKIARRYGVCTQTVCNIINGTAWKHL
jgi:hypothetical protein